MARTHDQLASHLVPHRCVVCEMNVITCVFVERVRTINNQMALQYISFKRSSARRF